MRNSFYLPILKSKAGEFNALSRLSPKVKTFIVPLLEVTPLEWDHSTKAKPKTIEEHLANFCKKVLKSWTQEDAFIDINLIADKDAGGLHCLEYTYSLLNGKRSNLMPVVRLTSSNNLLKVVKSLSKKYAVSEIGIRITVEDLTSPTLGDDIEILLSKIGFDPTNSHIILDLQDSDFTQWQDFAESLTEVLGDFPNIQLWKSFTVAGGAFPSTGKIKGPIQLVPRNDWKLYKEMLRLLEDKEYNRPLNFGDYSMVSPTYIEFDPTKMSTSANIRYTHNDVWIVTKGKALKKAIDWQQYFDQAKQIVQSNYYLGATFSFGDQHLQKCSKRETTSGNPNVWNTVGNNHHFTKVIMDLFSRRRAI